MVFTVTVLYGWGLYMFRQSALVLIPLLISNVLMMEVVSGSNFIIRFVIRTRIKIN